MTDIKIGDTVQVMQVKPATAFIGRAPDYYNPKVGQVGQVVRIDAQSWGPVVWVKLLDGVTTAFNQFDLQQVNE